MSEIDARVTAAALGDAAKSLKLFRERAGDVAPSANQSLAAIRLDVEAELKERRREAAQWTDQLLACQRAAKRPGDCRQVQRERDEAEQRLKAAMQASRTLDAADKKLRATSATFEREVEAVVAAATRRLLDQKKAIETYGREPHR